MLPGAEFGAGQRIALRVRLRSLQHRFAQRFLLWRQADSSAAISAIQQGSARVGPVTEALRGGLSARELVEQVLSEFQLEVLSEEPVEYRCYCSRERVTRALISMGREELNSLIREQGMAELTCQFCDKVYHYTNEELEGLLASL